jgi:endogenous inhibitor of DNA gyrase (YacG/DUF329 family)
MMNNTKGLVERFYQVLVDEIRRGSPSYLSSSFTVAEIYQSLIPYRTHRDQLGVEINGDYEDALLRLLAGEGDYLIIESDPARNRIRSELERRAPNTGIYREFAAVGVRLNPRMLPKASRVEASDGGVGEQTSLDGLALEGRAETPSRKDSPAREGAGLAKGEVVEAAAVPAASAPAPDPSRPPETTMEAAATSRTSASASPSGRGRAAAAREEPVMTEARETGAPSDCPECGKDLPARDKLRFCPFCGANVFTVPCAACSEELERGWSYCVACGEEQG